MISRPNAALLVLLASGLILAVGCSDRADTPTIAADSTLVYLGKNANDVKATITFASKSKVSKKTGRRRGVRTVFDLKEKARVHAFVDLTNRHARGEDALSFHLVWIKPNGKTAFKKRIEYTPSDTDTTIQGSFTISPARRDPGEYKLRVYLFRELIAEKSFRLRGEAGGEEEDEFEGVTM